MRANEVDLDDGMPSDCLALGVSPGRGDVVSQTRTLPNESQSLVSAFHRAGHVPSAEVQVLLQEALRVLKLAGVSVLETPNPNNIVVGREESPLDPTHLHPIPPQSLVCLSEALGFQRARKLRLQGSPELAESFPRSPDLVP